MSTRETVEAAVRDADAATDAVHQARAARDEAMRDARASGARPVQLAHASGVARSTVHAALRAGAGTDRGGDPLARVESAAHAWREAQQTERRAHDARNIAIAEALDGGAVQPADVRRVTGWSEGRVYQARDLGRALLAAQD